MERYSFSKLELFEQCPYKYKLKYVDKNYSQESTLVLEIGTLAHKGKEIWGEHLTNNESPDFNYIFNIIENGIETYEIHIINDQEIKNTKTEDILGLKDLKSKYFEAYIEKCNKSGLTYDEKVDIYLNNFKKPLEDGWRILDVEKYFQFIYNDKCILHGLIDRVDINENGDLRVVDYKSSKDTYKDEKLKTPLQMFIYTLACEKLYRKKPIEHIYDFVFIGEKQKACSPGYYNRGIKKLDKLLNNIEQCTIKNEYIPKPTPLCYWCDYCGNTPLADKKLNHLCSYYSLWTPNNKNFNVNQKYGEKVETKTNGFWF